MDKSTAGVPVQPHSSDDGQTAGSLIPLLPIQDMYAKSGQATFRFYEELNDFLPKDRKKRDFSAAFHRGDTVKAVIESLGVPHTEVDLVLVNGESVFFDYQVQIGDRSCP